MVRKKEPVKEELAKGLSPRKEERRAAYIKRRLHINCFGNCFEELFSFLKRERKKGIESPSIFSCNGFFKLIIKSLGSFFFFQKMKVF